MTAIIDHFPPIGYLMVSKMVVEENRKPCFMYREKRSNPEDSGWRIFSGFESDEYTEDPDNCGIYAPSTILNIDASIAELLLKGVGSVYEREADDSNWVKVTDFELEDDHLITHRLTERWTIVINNLFERIVEKNGELLYTTGDKSVRLTIWNVADKLSQSLYNDYKETISQRDQSKAITRQVFELSDNTILRIGYLIDEADETKSYNVIYGFCIIDHQVIQCVFYFDDYADLNWALDTWKNIKIN